MRTPHYYHTGTFKPFKDDFRRYGGQERTYKAGSVLVSSNMFMEETYYITKGIVRFYIIGEEGREKTISFTGEDCLFPLYSPVQHRFKLQYETMMMEAFTDIEVIVLQQTQLRNLMEKNSAAALAMLDLYADLADILLYETMKLSTADTETQICDFLIYYHDVLLPAGIRMNQSQMAACIGTNLLNVARVFKTLREEKIIATARGKVKVLQYDALVERGTKELLP